MFERKRPASVKRPRFEGGLIFEQGDRGSALLQNSAYCGIHVAGLAPSNRPISTTCPSMGLSAKASTTCLMRGFRCVVTFWSWNDVVAGATRRSSGSCCRWGWRARR